MGAGQAPEDEKKPTAPPLPPGPPPPFPNAPSMYPVLPPLPPGDPPPYAAAPPPYQAEPLDQPLDDITELKQPSRARAPSSGGWQRPMETALRGSSDGWHVTTEGNNTRSYNDRPAPRRGDHQSWSSGTWSYQGAGGGGSSHTRGARDTYTAKETLSGEGGWSTPKQTSAPQDRRDNRRDNRRSEPPARRDDQSWSSGTWTYGGGGGGSSSTSYSASNRPAPSAPPAKHSHSGGSGGPR